MEKASIIKRVEKLLALSESSNKFEAKTAMFKANKIIMKNKLSISNFKNMSKEVKSINIEATDITFTKALWKVSLAETIADNFGCYYFINKSGTNRIVFMGADEDLYLCKKVYYYMIKVIKNKMSSMKYCFYKRSMSIRGLETEFAFGFIHGLNNLFSEENMKSSYGRYNSKDVSLMKEFKSINFTGSVEYKVDFCRTSAIYTKGIYEGESFSHVKEIEKIKAAFNN